MKALTKLKSRIKLFFAKKKRVIDTPKWNPIDEFKSKLTIEDLKFIFEQAEKKLNDTVQESSIIVTRNGTLISLITATLIALFGFIITKLNSSLIIDEMFITCTIGSLYLFTLGVYTFNSLKPKTYLVSGSTPEDNFNSAYFTELVPDDKRIYVYYMNEIVNYQFKIEENTKVNKKRWNRFNLSLFLLIFFPICMLGSYFFTKIICF